MSKPAPRQFSPVARLAQESPKVKLAQAAPEPGAIVPHSDWFAARDELLSRFRLPPGALAAPFAGPRVLGVGVGLRSTQGRLTGEICVKVFVAKKLCRSSLGPLGPIPATIGGKVTDVEQITPPILHAAERYDRAVPCGVSVGLADVPEIGTIGALVVTKNNDLCILSNNHVLANSNGSTNFRASVIGQKVLQPGQTAQGPMLDDWIGMLHDFVPLKDSESNLVDAALALTSFDLVAPGHVSYTLDPTPVQAALGMTVTKYGMMTGSTVGMITDIGVGGLRVPYEELGTVTFDNQIVVRGVSGAAFSSAGDSGSLIVSLATKQPVALLFAGGQDQTGFVTYANSIGDVMDALNIDRFVAERESQ